LFKLALALLDIVYVQVEHTSKAEYGYQLYSATQPSAHKGGFSELKKNQAIEDAMRCLVGDCIAHIQSNVQGVLLKLDDEYLHQVRIGLRRLRVVLAITLHIQADAELAALRQQVSELCVGLGVSRDLDVFIAQTLIPLCARLPEHKGLREISRASERARKKQHAGIEDKLGSADFQRMLLRFGAWMHSEQLYVSNTSIELFISKSLKKRLKDVVNCKEALQVGDKDRLHRLRIACKKLRYCIEMFDSLFDREKSRAYLGVLADLQDVLGRFNDYTVAHRLASTLDSKDRHEVVALIHEELERDVAQLNAEFMKAWKRFAKLKFSWE
jgi:CHAD domain-containing protein